MEAVRAHGAVSDTHSLPHGRREGKEAAARSSRLGRGQFDESKVLALPRSCIPRIVSWLARPSHGATEQQGCVQNVGRPLAFNRARKRGPGKHREEHRGKTEQGKRKPVSKEQTADHRPATPVDAIGCEADRVPGTKMYQHEQEGQRENHRPRALKTAAFTRRQLIPSPVCARMRKTVGIPTLRRGLLVFFRRVISEENSSWAPGTRKVPEVCTVVKWVWLRGKGWGSGGKVDGRGGFGVRGGGAGLSRMGVGGRITCGAVGCGEGWCVSA